MALSAKLVLWKSASRCIVAALVISSIVGCARSVTSNDPNNLEEWVEQIQRKPAPPLPPIPVLQQFETFIYNDQGLRDPFAPPLDTRSASAGPRPDPDRRKQPLEAYPLDSLNMVGTLNTTSPGAIVGLVMSPDRVLHRLTPGMYVGQSDGRVTAVHPDKIDITELVPDGAGGWIERPASIAIANQ
jgi:type IV pilus assembly protein PilP